MAYHFLPTTLNPLANQANHKNFNKEDNHYLNLEWVTLQENVDHAIAGGKYDARVYPPRVSYVTEEMGLAVVEARKSGKLVGDIEKEFGMSTGSVYTAFRKYSDVNLINSSNSKNVV